jgi:hypothetical protein
VIAVATDEKFLSTYSRQTSSGKQQNYNDGGGAVLEYKK